MRWRQVWNEELGRHEMVPCDAAAANRDAGIIVRGNFDAFRSPIDGSLIKNQRDYENHMKKHNVVPAAEFSPEYYARKAEERARLYTGERTHAEKQQRGEEIHRIIERLERR